MQCGHSAHTLTISVYLLRYLHTISAPHVEARLKQPMLSIMPNEHVGYSRQEPEEHPDKFAEREQENLLWRNNEVRKSAKDLLLNVEELPDNMPYRAKVIQMVTDILTLVPVLDSEDEVRDEHKREELAKGLKRRMRRE